MEKEFVSYEQALALKELGFDEKCLGWYSSFDKLLEIGNLRHSFYTLAPLKQQVFRWFREKYQLEGILERSGLWLWFKFEIYELYKDCKLMRCAKLEFNTYEEAENACIDKLIELSKQLNKQ